MMGTNSAIGCLHFINHKEERKPLLKVLEPKKGIYTTTRHYPLILAGWCGKWTQKYICVSNGSPCSPQVKKKSKLCKIESFQWSKKIILWSQGECLSKSYIKSKRSWTMEKRKQTLAMSQESFLERISLPITVLALIGLTNTVTLYLEYNQNHFLNVKYWSF